MTSQYAGKRNGFSWVETLAVATVVGIAAAIVLPHLTTSQDAARTRDNRRNQAEINAAVERWYVEKGQWPQADLKDIGGDAEYFPGGLPTNPADGRPYTLNAATHRVE